MRGILRSIDAAARQLARQVDDRWRQLRVLEDLLKWRELMYHFCAHAPHHDTLAALPTWLLTVRTGAVGTRERGHPTPASQPVPEPAKVEP